MNKEKKLKVIIAGGSGFLGQALTSSFLKQGIEVIVLSRSGPSDDALGEFVYWDGTELGDWVKELESAEVLINLTGRSVDCRYTSQNRALILDSRVNSTKILGRAISGLMSPPMVWLNASTATIYSDVRGDTSAHDETSEGNAQGFSEEVGRAWERALFECSHKDVRQIAMRISIVLGKDGGAFPVMRRFAKLGLGGAQGPGSQWMSWLHIDDWVAIVHFLIENHSISGAVNLASPNPVTNSSFMREMRKNFAPLGIGLPAPSIAVHLGAMLIGTAPELVLKSRKVCSKVLRQHGYDFIHPNISSCLEQLSRGN